MVPCIPAESTHCGGAVQRRSVVCVCVCIPATRVREASHKRLDRGHAEQRSDKLLAHP